MAKKYQIGDGRYLLSLDDKFFFFSAYCLRTSAIKFSTRFRGPGSTGVSANCRSDKPGRIRLVNSCTDKFILSHFLVGKLPVSAADVNSAVRFECAHSPRQLLLALYFPVALDVLFVETFLVSNARVWFVCLTSARPPKCLFAMTENDEKN